MSLLCARCVVQPPPPCTTAVSLDSHKAVKLTRYRKVGAHWAGEIRSYKYMNTTTEDWLMDIFSVLKIEMDGNREKIVRRELRMIHRI